MGGEQSIELVEELVWLDTGWACGGVRVRGDLIIGGAPIFKKLCGQLLSEVVKRGKYIAIRLGQ